MDPQKIPEKQLQPIVRPIIERKPRLGQGRAGIKTKVKLAQCPQKKEVIGPDSSRPKTIIISDEAVMAVDPILPVPSPEIPRNKDCCRIFF